MKLSVIVTTWQCEPWLAACRASVRAACARLDQAEGVVEVIEVCNGVGVSAARNEGLARATGDWFVFVDGDDVIAPEFFVEVARHAKAADLIRLRLASFAGDEDFQTNPPVRPFPFGWVACAYHRSVIPEAGFEPYCCGEDTLFLLAALIKARRVVEVERIVYGYRRRVGSATSSPPTLRRFRDRAAFGVAWLQLAAQTDESCSAAIRQERTAATRSVAKDVLGSLAIEVRLLDPQPWAEFYAALGRLLATGALPRTCALRVRLCRMLRWRWLARGFRK